MSDSDCSNVEYRLYQIQDELEDYKLKFEESQADLIGRLSWLGSQALTSWLINLPAHLACSVFLYCVIKAYMWMTRREISKDFRVETFVLILLCLFYPLTFWALTIMMMKDVCVNGGMAKKPKPDKATEAVMVTCFVSVEIAYNFLFLGFHGSHAAPLAVLDDFVEKG